VLKGVHLIAGEWVDWAQSFVNEPVSCGLVGKYVNTFMFPDGRLEVKWRRMPLPYTVFDNDQRITHVAITAVTCETDI